MNAPVPLRLRAVPEADPRAAIAYHARMLKAAYEAYYPGVAIHLGQDLKAPEAVCDPAVGAVSCTVLSTLPVRGRR